MSCQSFCTLTTWLADPGGCAQLLLQVGGGREVVGVRVGVEDPDDLDARSPHIVEDQVGIVGRRGAGPGIEVPDRVDDGTLHGRRVVEDVLPTAGAVARNMADVQVHRLPVVDRDKRLVGFVALADIARAAGSDVAGAVVAGISAPTSQHSQGG
jgi:hypothetical protein